MRGGGIAALADNFIPRGGPAAGNKIIEIDGGTVRANIALNGDGGGVFVKYTVGAVPVVELNTTTITQNQARGTAPAQKVGGVWTNGRGGGVAVFGPATVNGNAATDVSNNGQSAPVNAPAVLGVYLDVGVAGTFAGAATIHDNYLIP